MKIIIDTREQRRLDFECETIIKCLKFGDYGCIDSAGVQIPVVFERKSKNDLYGSLTQGYDRLRKVFHRAEKSGFKLVIVIEGDKENILRGCDHSARDPESIIKQLETINTKYGVSHMFFKTRHQMSAYIQSYFEAKENEWKAKGMEGTTKDKIAGTAG